MSGISSASFGTLEDMASFSLGFTFRSAPDDPLSPEPSEPAHTDSGENLFADPPEMQPAWAEGSSLFHTRARCSHLSRIEPRNLRTQSVEPAGKTLCEICRKITLSGRKG